MDSKDIYIGTIKKCKNLFYYEEYGEERFIPDFVIGKSIHGGAVRYVEKVSDNAVLIKVDNENYIWIDMLNNKIDELLVNLGFAVKTINTYPSTSNKLFVDEKTLKPYFKHEINNLRLNQVKTLALNLKNK